MTIPPGLPSTRTEGYVAFVSLAAWLQAIIPEKTILLPVKQVAALLGVKDVTVSRYRAWAVRDGLLVEVKAAVPAKRPGQGRATEFRFELSHYPGLVERAEALATVQQFPAQPPAPTEEEERVLEQAIVQAFNTARRHEMHFPVWLWERRPDADYMCFICLVAWLQVNLGFASFRLPPHVFTRFFGLTPEQVAQFVAWALDDGLLRQEATLTPEYTFPTWFLSSLLEAGQERAAATQRLQCMRAPAMTN